ncbi:MAG TPA: AI-2E family transporter [Terriglobia bacterium]|nr:AI-2E family transporter [Terriglobia bacterium]
MTADLGRFAWRVLIAVLIIGLVAAMAYAIHLILLVFAGVLLAIFLRTVGCWLSHNTRIPIHWSMVIVLISFAVVMFGILWMFGQQIAQQADDLYLTVTQAYNDFQMQLRQYSLGQQMLAQFSDVDLKATAATAASGLLRTAGAGLLVLFLGLYLSTRPELCTEAFLSLFSSTQRARMTRLLDSLGAALRWWLLGQLIAMGVVGVITTIGLFILGAPMAIPLGVLAGLLTFIPYVGAIVSAVPAVLIALTKGRDLALYVVLLYLLAHILEGCVIVPLIQHRLVYLPPAVTLVSQFFMEIFVGGMGIAFATPLLVVSMVLVKQLYFKQDWYLKTVRLKE